MPIADEPMLSLPPCCFASAITSVSVFAGKRRMREQRDRHRCDQPDRREILARVEAGIGIETGIDRQRAGMAEEQRMTVGRALDEGAGTDQAGAAGAIVDHDLLAKRSRKFFRHHARQGVDATPGRIGHDQGDGSCGVSLRECPAVDLERREAAAANDKNDRGRNRGPDQGGQLYLPSSDDLRATTTLLDTRQAAAESRPAGTRSTRCVQWTRELCCRRAISSFTSNLRRFNSTISRSSIDGCARASWISASSARCRLSSSARCACMDMLGGSPDVRLCLTRHSLHLFGAVSKQVLIVRRNNPRFAVTVPKACPNALA